MLSGILMFPVTTKAQDAEEQEAAEETEVVEEAPAPAAPIMVDDEIMDEEKGFHQIIKEKFIEGDPTFMSPVLICLILGLAVALERIITLNLSTTNTKKLLAKVEEALEQGGIEAAKDVTKSTKGPVASIFTQGLMRYSEGIEMVEKSIIAYGSV